MKKTTNQKSTPNFSSKIINRNNKFIITENKYCNPLTFVPPLQRPLYKIRNIHSNNNIRDESARAEKRGGREIDNTRVERATCCLVAPTPDAKVITLSKLRHHLF